jgi:hypothetical protein
LVLWRSYLMRGHSPVFWLRSDLHPVDRTFNPGIGSGKSR